MIFILSFFSLNSFAENRYDYKAPSCGSCTVSPTLEQACQKYVSTQNKSYQSPTAFTLLSFTEPPLSQPTNGTAGSCSVRTQPPAGNSIINVSVSYTKAADCPNGKTFDQTTLSCTSSCVAPQVFDTATQTCQNPPVQCTLPFVRDAVTNTCKRPSEDCTLKTGQNAGDIYYKAVGGSKIQCDGACMVKGNNILHTCIINGEAFDINSLSGTSMVDGCYMKSTFTGSSCSSIDMAKPAGAVTPKDQSSCTRSGGSWGVVNGVGTCAPSSGGNNAPLGTGTGIDTGLGTGSGNVKSSGEMKGESDSKAVGDAVGEAIAGGTGTPQEKYLCALHPDSLACQNVTSGTGSTITANDIHTEAMQAGDFQASVNSFVSTVQSSAWYGGINNFFTVNISGGSCTGMDGAFVVQGSTFDVNMNPVFCSATAQTSYAVLKIGLLLAASFVAFRWAFY